MVNTIIIREKCEFMEELGSFTYTQRKHSQCRITTNKLNNRTKEYPATAKNDCYFRKYYTPNYAPFTVEHSLKSLLIVSNIILRTLY